MPWLFLINLTLAGSLRLSYGGLLWTDRRGRGGNSEGTRGERRETPAMAAAAARGASLVSLAVAMAAVVLFSAGGTAALWMELPKQGTKCVSEEIQAHVVVIGQFDVHFEEHTPDFPKISAKVSGRDPLPPVWVRILVIDDCRCLPNSLHLLGIFGLII